MTTPVDSNDPVMTGENSFIRLSPDGGKTQSDRLSHWRVLWCPSGTGHALFIQSTLTDGQVRIYSDNAAVARWLQRTIETLLFPAFADERVPVISAKFTRMGDPRSTAVETVVSAADQLRPPSRDVAERMTWCTEASNGPENQAASSRPSGSATTLGA